MSCYYSSKSLIWLDQWLNVRMVVLDRTKIFIQNKNSRNVMLRSVILILHQCPPAWWGVAVNAPCYADIFTLMTLCCELKKQNKKNPKKTNTCILLRPIWFSYGSLYLYADEQLLLMFQIPNRNPTPKDLYVLLAFRFYKQWSVRRQKQGFYHSSPKKAGERQGTFVPAGINRVIFPEIMLCLGVEHPSSLLLLRIASTMKAA